MKDIDKRSGGGLEIKFLINSMDLPWIGVIPKWARSKRISLRALKIRMLCNFVLMWAKK